MTQEKGRKSVFPGGLFLLLLCLLLGGTLAAAETEQAGGSIAGSGIEQAGGGMTGSGTEQADGGMTGSGTEQAGGGMTGSGTEQAGGDAAGTGQEPGEETEMPETVSIRVNKSSIVMIQGKTYRLRASGENLPKAVKWRSSNKKVAKVDKTGKVTARAAGEATITAKSGKYKAACKVTVYKAALNQTKLSLEKGKSKKLKVTGSAAKVKWKSSNPKIVAVNSKGKIRAKAPGTAKIYAKVGVHRLSCKVTVTYSRWSQLLDEYKEDSGTKQLVFVKYEGGSRAAVQMYEKNGGKWSCIVDCQGYVGRNGIDKVREGDGKTPTGTFSLTHAFGIQDDPGAKLPYVKVNSYLYWCADQSHYNQLIDIRQYPHSCSGEHLINYVPHYYYGMFLDFNKENVYQKGAAIFLHCTGSNPYTAGCVAVSQADMIKIIQHAEEGAKICIYPE